MRIPINEQRCKRSTVLKNWFSESQFGACALVFQSGTTQSFSTNGVTEDLRINIGSFAKTLTCTLVAIAAKDGLLNLTDSCCLHLGGHTVFPNNAALVDVRIFHLLNHTHGIDNSLFSTSNTADGLLNREKMVSCLDQASSLATPGAIFHYGNAGILIAGAILESLYSAPLHQILQFKLFDKLEISIQTQEFNPAAGGALKLSGENLLRITNFCFFNVPKDDEVAAQLRLLRSRFVVPVRPWPRMGKKYLPGGWMDYGNSVGQYGRTENSSLAIRVFPRRQRVLVVTSNNERSAQPVLSKLFGDEVRDINPALGGKVRSANVASPDRFVGRYRNSRYLLEVYLDAARHLALRLFEFGPDEEAILVKHGTLLPIQENVFVSQDTGKPKIPYYVFFGRAPKARCDYIDTARFMVRRES